MNTNMFYWSDCKVINKIALSGFITYCESLLFID